MSSSPPEVLVDRVEQLRELGRYDDAERAARAALAECPNDSTLLAALAAVLHQAGQSSAGLQAADAAVAAEPTAERGHRLRALLLADLGWHADAVGAGATAVQLAPHNPYAARANAIVLQRARQLAAAAEEARRALALEPDSADGHVLLADIADELGDRQTARAEYERALEINPDHAIALNDLAVLDLKSRRLGAGLRGFLDAGAAAPELDIVLHNVTQVLWRLSWRLRIGLIVAVFVVAAAGGRSPAVGRAWADGGAAASGWSVRGAAAGVVIACLAVAFWSSRQLPANARPATWQALRDDRFLRFTYVSILCCVGMFVAIVITGIAALAGIVWIMLGVLGGVALWASYRTRRRRRIRDRDRQS